MILLRGKVVEMGATEKVYGNPVHPYTKMLIASVPLLHKKWRQVGPGACTRPGRGSAEHCAYHAMYPKTARPAPPTAARPAFAEVEEDHFVGCIRPYVEGTCCRRPVRR